MSTKYIVEIDLRTTGNLPQTVSGAAGKFDTLAAAASRAYGAVNSLSAGALGGFTRSVEWAAGKVWDVGKAFGAAGIGAGIAAATYGVLTLNRELETTKVSLGAVLGASGFTSSVNSGLQMGGDLIKQMREDAKKLPGEFQDLLMIFQTAAVPAFRSGLDPQQWEKLSSKVMATSKAVSLPMDQAAREFAQLLEGRSGAHNVFGMRLLGLSGDVAQQFNKMKPEERLAKLTTELDKYGKYIDAFGESFDAQSSTAIDNGKEFIRLATEPLFDEAKKTLKDINRWFETNKDEISVWATNFGLRLAHAWEWGRKKAEEWWPLIREFAGTAWDRLRKFWDEIQPQVQAFAKWMKEGLADPNGTIDKLILLGKLYAGAKVAQGGLGLLGGLGSSAGAAIPLLAQMGMMPGMGAAAATGTAGAAGAAGGGLGLGAAGATTVGGVGVGVAGLGLAALAAGIAGTVAQFQLFKLTSEATTHVIEGYQREHSNVKNEMRRYLDTVMELPNGAMLVRGKFTELEAAGDDLRVSMLAAAIAARNFADGAPDRNAKTDMITQNAQDAISKGFTMELQKQRSEKANEKTKRPGGHGGTSIQKVEIVVTSNQNPERIARSVTDELAKLSRNRKSSRFTTNYSNPTKG
jgi:hypothetical protein